MSNDFSALRRAIQDGNRVMGVSAAECREAADALATLRAEKERLEYQLKLHTPFAAELAKLRADNERLRAAVRRAHAALTKNSLGADERVHDAMVILGACEFSERKLTPCCDPVRYDRGECDPACELIERKNAP